MGSTQSQAKTKNVNAPRGHGPGRRVHTPPPPTNYRAVNHVGLDPMDTCFTPAVDHLPT